MSGLPPLASDEDTETVLDACRNRRAYVSSCNAGQTERLLRVAWGTNFARLREAVAEHIEAKRRMYQKFDGGRPICLQANVTLYEELNVYVEMKIKRDRVVI